METTTVNPTIATRLNWFRFDMSDASQKDAYLKLYKETLFVIGFKVWKSDYSRGEGAYIVKAFDHIQKLKALSQGAGIVNLETKYLFEDQWNCAEGFRLHNYVEYKYPNKNIIEGYWLEQTNEMRDVLRNTLKCGYCGHQQPAAGAPIFCGKCLDSQYLTEKELHMTRLRRVCDTHKPSPVMSEAEREERTPLWRAAQTQATTERAKALKEKVQRRAYAEFEKATEDAIIKRDATLWLVDNAPGLLDNWIYYSHTNTHCFGWRKKLTKEVHADTVKLLENFPYPVKYELEGA